MINIKSKKAFTLIELLVVITIIGILATAGVNVFTGQLQKARDSTRLSGLKSVEVAIVEYNGDYSKYPDSTSTLMSTIGSYIANKIPLDPKGKTATCNSLENTATASSGASLDKCVYLYGVANAVSSNDSYKLSAALENSNNLIIQAQKDGGSFSGRLEIYGGGSGSTIAAGSLYEVQ